MSRLNMIAMASREGAKAGRKRLKPQNTRNTRKGRSINHTSVFSVPSVVNAVLERAV